MVKDSPITGWNDDSHDNFKASLELLNSDISCEIEEKKFSPYSHETHFGPS